jgi:hypothetical protein
MATCRTSKLLSNSASSRSSRVVQPKRQKMLLGLVPSLVQNTRRNRRLVNVDTATPLIEHFHPCLLCRARKDAECESLPRVLFREERYSPLFLNASRVKLISGFETPMQVTTSCGHDHNSLTPFSSVVVTEGHEQLIPFPGTRSSAGITTQRSHSLPQFRRHKINFARDLQDRLGILALLALSAPFRICKLQIPLPRRFDPVSGHHY